MHMVMSSDLPFMGTWQRIRRDTGYLCIFDLYYNMQVPDIDMLEYSEPKYGYNAIVSDYNIARLQTNGLYIFYSQRCLLHAEYTTSLQYLSGSIVKESNVVHISMQTKLEGCTEVRLTE